MVKKLKFLVMMLLFMAVISPAVTVHAAQDLNTTLSDINKGINGDKSSYYQKALNEIEDALKGYSNSTAVDATSITVGTTTRSLSASDYNSFKAVAESKLIVAQNSANSVQDGSVDSVKNDITNMVKNEFNIKADTGAATKALEGFREPIQMIVGILSWVVITGLGLFTALDIAFITQPVFRGWYSDSAQSGSKVTGTTDKKTGEAKLRWISDEAVYAVKVATLGEGKSALSIYLFKRMAAYVITAIVIFMLLTGNIQIFVNLALDLVAGIIEQIQKLAS